MALDDSFTDGASKSHAFADFLRRGERLKDLRQNVGRNSHAVIAYNQLHFAGLHEAATDPEIASVRHRVDGVHDQRQDHLLDLRSVAIYRWHHWVGGKLYLHAL